MTVYISGTTGYSGPVGVLGDLTTTGNTVLGDASTDTLNVGNGNLVLNASANMGLSVTPSAWTSTVKALQINTTGALWANSSTIYLTNNTFTDGTDKYLTTAAATRYYQSSGAHIWNTAASGTAGTAATFNQTMTLDANGSLVINYNSSVGSPVGKLQVWENTTSSSYVCIDARSGQAGGSTPNAYTTTLIEGSGANTGSSGNVAIKMSHNDNIDLRGELSFWTKDSTNTQYERMRITATGYVGIGTSSPDSILTFAGNITSKSSDSYGIGTNGGNNHFNVFATGASGAVRFWTGGSSATSTGGGGSERARIDSSGNLGVGTTSPNRAGVGTAISVSSSSYAFLEANYNNARAGYLFSVGAGTYVGEYRSATLYLTTSDTTRARIDSSGNFYSNEGGSGSFWPRASGAYANLSDLTTGTFPIQVQETNTGTTASRYIPIVGQTSISAYGYRQYTVFGSYRAADYGSAFIGVGGNDSYPTVAFLFSKDGNFTAPGTKSFTIDHPLPSMTETHQLIHAAIEGPAADLIYRGNVVLVDGRSEVNIDTVSRMTEGTFEVLCRNVQCFTTNETDWTAVKGSVTGNILTIEAQDPSCTATVSWMVIGERKDKNMFNDERPDGRLIVEKLKEPT